MTAIYFLDKIKKRRSVGEGGISMNMQEVVRLLTGLRDMGLPEKEINDFLMYIGSGNDVFRPRSKVKVAEN